MIGFEIVAITLLTLASAFCSCTEIAFFSLPSSRIKSFRSQLSLRKRQVARILQQPKSLLVTIFMLNTVVNILVQNTASNLFEQFSGGWLLKVGLPLSLVLIFGELVPKYLGLLQNEAIAVNSAPIIETLLWLTRPFRFAITEISNFISRIFFFFLKPEKPLSKEELQHILQNSEGKGLLHRDEAELILGVLSLEDKQIKEVMEPRSSMPSYDIKEPLSKLIYLFSEHHLPQICVIQMPEESVLGMITARDFFIWRSEINTPNHLLTWLKKPFFVPETTSAKAVLEQLREQNISIALIIDEYGTTTGQISQRDLVNQVVKAKRTVKRAQEEFTYVSKDAIVASGTLPLAQVRELFGVDIENAHHVVTIGGWLAEKLGMIPQTGATWHEKELFFRVLSADQTRLRKVYIQYQKKKEPKEVR